MKKIIKLITVICFLILGTTVNSQIKNTKTLINTNKINVKTNTIDSGLKLDINKLNTNTDYKKLNLPVTQISKEKLNAKPVNTWKITPLKSKDGQLELKSLFGVYTNSHWQTGVEVKNHNSSFTDLSPNFPLSINFRASGGVEYRLKLIDQMKHRNAYVYIAIRDVNGMHAYINRVEFDRNNTLYYSFYEENSKDIIIDISFVSTNSAGREVDFNCLKLSEIEISKLKPTE